MDWLDRWKTPEQRTNEDKLLVLYCQEVGGTVFTEVAIGQGGLREYPAAVKPRRIDAVRIPTSGTNRIVTFNKRDYGQEFEDLVSGAQVEVIEVKESLNRTVIGQAIVGADILEMEYEGVQVTPVTMCAFGDPLLKKVCEKRGIKVWIAIDD